MLLILNGKITFEYQYCQQCGSCLAVCPTKSLSAKRLKNGLVDIQIDQDTCIKCKKCIKSCPAAIGDQIEEYNRDFPKKKYYFARSNDADIRYLSSSGGTCKTLIIQALKQGLMGYIRFVKQISILMLKECFIRKKTFLLMMIFLIQYTIL